MSRRRSSLAGVATLVLFAVPAAAQEGRALHLDSLHAAAVRRDPRAGQGSLLRAQSALRQANLDAERLPALSVEGQAQYQSDVARIPFTLPGGTQPDAPPKDTYDARLVARQRLLDPSLAPRRELERAQLAEAEARLGTTLYGLRSAVNEAFFAALLLQSQRAEVATVVTDLEAQHALAVTRVREGAALPGEAAILEAELLRRRETLAELDATRAASLEVLGRLTGVTIAGGDTLVLPSAQAPRAVVTETVRGRPEFAQFARSRDVLARQEEVAAARDKPRLVAFGRAGYGRPGLNPLAAEFDAYWLAGLQVEWTPWSWGTTKRERRVLALQREIVDSEEAAFADAVQRALAQDLAAVGRLEAALRTDERIIALREQVLRETAARHREGVVTAAEYVDRRTDLTNARLARARHVVELAQANARLLTQMGMEVRE